MRQLELQALIASSLGRKALFQSKAISKLSLIESVAEVATLIINSFKLGGKLIVFGNGGSASDASHFCAEFTGRFKLTRKALPALCLNDCSHITAVANDFGFDYVFSRGVEAFAEPLDIVLGISTSGNSPNVINGLTLAQAKGLTTIALLGRDGGFHVDYSDYTINVGGDSTDSIQELHMSILHTIVEIVEMSLA